MANKKIQKSIEIVRSSIPALSSMGKKSGDALYALLQAHYETVTLNIVNTLADLEQVAARKPDLVFIGMKCVPGTTPGSKVWLADFLDQLGIRYTGSSSRAIQSEQSKPVAKQLVAAAGVATAKFVVLKHGDTYDPATNALQFPLFVKPSDLGAGNGIDENSVVHDLDELQAQVTMLSARHDTDILIEEFLSGREYSVAVLKSEDSDELLVMPLEQVPEPNKHGYRILGHELKSAPLETPVFPVTDIAVRESLIKLARDAFTALGARDYGRIDTRMNDANVPHFLEANLIPCIIEGSGNFAKACVMNADINYEAMILRIVRLGLAHPTAGNPVHNATM